MKKHIQRLKIWLRFEVSEEEALYAQELEAAYFSQSVGEILEEEAAVQRLVEKRARERKKNEKDKRGN